jgi:hypothetical protein
MTSLDFKIDLTLASLFLLSMGLNRIPKKYKGKFWDFLRNNYHKHIFLGGLYGMILSTTFLGVPIFIQLVITLFTTWALGTLWEWAWGALKRTEVDYNDVYYAMAAACIAVVYHLG